MKFYAVMLGHNRPEVIEGGMKSFKDTVDESPYIEKHFFDCGYPLPNKKDNMLRNLELANQYGWSYDIIHNKGILANWNTVIHEYLKMQNGDFLFTYDPDVRIRPKGWVPAFMEALQSDPDVMFCSSALDFHHHDWMYKPPYLRRVIELQSGLKIAKYVCLISWASGCWKADFLITRPRHFGEGIWYGNSECSDYQRLIDNGKTWIALVDYVDYHLPAMDPEYKEWKEGQASGNIKTSFEQWLGERKK